MKFTRPIKSCAGLQCPAFSLIELLIALVVLTMLMGVVVLSLVNWQTGAQLESSAMHVQTLIRMARAEAALKGQRLQLQFDQEAGRWMLEIEADPLAEPNVYEAYSPPSWASRLEMPNAYVARCDITSALGLDQIENAQGFDAPGEDDSEAEFAPIKFHPNGRSDSAVIELVHARGADVDTRTAVLVIDGESGSVECVFYGADDYVEAFDRDPPLETEGDA